MNRHRYLLPGLALAGLLLTLAVVIHDSRPHAARPPRTAPAAPPFTAFVAGTGIVEASSGNIAVGTPRSGVVTEVMVKVGDRVRNGDPLFRIDTRQLQAQLATAKAKVAVSAARLTQTHHHLDYDESLRRRDPGAVSAQQLTALHDQAAVAEAELALARAAAAQVGTELDQCLVRAPVDGQVLRLTLRRGEYLSAGGAAPLLLFGADRTLYLRVDVDQSEAWRVHPGARAVAFGRGDPRLRIPLHFEYIEPDVVPKRSLTGSSTERTDTRVLQVLYSFPRDALPVHVGQQLEVFIDSPAPESQPAPGAG